MDTPEERLISLREWWRSSGDWEVTIKWMTEVEQQLTSLRQSILSTHAVAEQAARDSFGNHVIGN